VEYLSFIASAAALVFLSAPQAAQPVATVEIRQGTCNCSIDAAEFVRVGDVSGPGMVSDQGRLAIDKRGRVFLSGPKQGNVVKLFSPHGKFVRVIGRPGTGPGEFTSPYTVAFGGSSLTHVFDAIPQRWIVFDSAFRSVATSTVPFAAVGAVLFGDDVAVLTGESHGKETVGYPLHLFSRTRGLVRSFGSANGLLDPRNPRDMVRVIAAASEARVWSARINSYEIEQYDTLGVLRARFRRNVNWFRPWTTQVPTALEQRPLPTVSDIRQDEDGLLWVLVQVADLDWRPREGIQRPAGVYVPDTMHELIYDTIIEVIDPRTSQLLASTRFRQQFRRFAGERMVYRYNEDSSDNPFYSAYRLTLTGLDR
jgi:hypothetical protein